MASRPNFDKGKDSVNGLDFPFDVSETWPLIHYTIIYCLSLYSIDGYSSFNAQD